MAVEGRACVSRRSASAGRAAGRRPPTGPSSSLPSPPRARTWSWPSPSPPSALPTAAARRARCCGRPDGGRPRRAAAHTTPPGPDPCAHRHARRRARRHARQLRAERRVSVERWQAISVQPEAGWGRTVARGLLLPGPLHPRVLRRRGRGQAHLGRRLAVRRGGRRAARSMVLAAPVAAAATLAPPIAVAGRRRGGRRRRGVLVGRRRPLVAHHELGMARGARGSRALGSVHQIYL